MRFPSAYSGVKKIFTAEILTIIGTIATLVSLIGALASAGVVEALDDTEASAGALVSAGLFLIITVAGLVLLTVGAILQIVGVIIARRDEPAFKPSLIFIIIANLCSIDQLFAGLPAGVKAVTGSIKSIAELCVVLFIIQGIRNLADRMNNGKVSAKGQKIFFLLAIVYLIIFISKIVSLFTQPVATIISLVATVLNLIVYIIFLTYLSQAKKMLAK